VGQALVDIELGRASGGFQGAVCPAGVAEEQVPGAGNQGGGGKPRKTPVDRRDPRILQVLFPGIKPGSPFQYAPVGDENAVDALVCVQAVSSGWACFFRSEGSVWPGFYTKTRKTRPAGFCLRLHRRDRSTPTTYQVSAQGLF
jgi:hypothetical protein